MTTRLVSSTVVGIDGVALSSVPVEIELLLADAFVITGSYSMATKLRLQTDPAGAWTTPLECNDDLTPVGTLYSVTEKIPAQYGGVRTYLIQVLTGLAAPPNIHQAANLLVPEAVPVGGTYQAVQMSGINGTNGINGYITTPTNATLNAITPKVVGLPIWVVATQVFWVWNGTHYELLNYPDFVDSTARGTALSAVGLYASQATYLRSNTTTEGPVWQNSNNVVGQAWNMPWGEIPGAYAEITANSASFSGLADIAGLSITFTHTNRRRMMIYYTGEVETSAANGEVIMSLCYPGFTQVDRAVVQLPIFQEPVKWYAAVRAVSTGASQTYKVRGLSLGGPTAIVQAQADQKAYVQAVDIGPSGAPA